MTENLKRIVFAYLQNKQAEGGYVEPLRNDMEQYPFHNDQEQSYTDLSQLDSVHGGPTTDLFDKMFMYPEQETCNPDWGGGNFLSPYSNNIVHDMWQTPQDAETLMDPLMTSPEMHGLNSKTSSIDLNSRTSSIDFFLNDNNQKCVKVSSMDLTDFMKVSDDTLVHRSNRDLWKMYKDADGNVFINRLFDEELVKD